MFFLSYFMALLWETKPTSSAALNTAKQKQLKNRGSFEASRINTSGYESSRWVSDQNLTALLLGRVENRDLCADSSS